MSKLFVLSIGNYWMIHTNGIKIYFKRLYKCKFLTNMIINKCLSKMKIISPWNKLKKRGSAKAKKTKQKETKQTAARLLQVHLT